MAYSVRNAAPTEFYDIGQLMVQVYSQLEGFPKPAELPSYYTVLENAGDFTLKPGTELLVAVADTGPIQGAVVYFNDIQHYAAGMLINESAASGFRLLAVHPDARGRGVGTMLINACIDRAKRNGNRQVIIHTTKAMQKAWNMYEAMGFKRSPDLDFTQNNVEVFGLRLQVL
jgi:GNAT superfamily N-acetyltransferase